jgi:hypothetical protein
MSDNNTTISSIEREKLRDALSEPFSYDPHAIVDIDIGISNLLESHSLTGTDIQQLPLSSFYDYTKSKETLLVHQQKIGIASFTGNKLFYLSAGDTSSQYITGSFSSPSAPVRNLLNRYQPTVNSIALTGRRHESQIGGHLLPHNTAVLTYASIRPRPFFLEERIIPGEMYVFPDPELYGNGFGGGLIENIAPIDHIEDVTWLKADYVNIGMAGMAINTNKLPLFYNYTSKENTLNHAQHGVSRFTDNFDFWTGSISGSVWANDDVYPLIEANRYTINSRQDDLLTDLCNTIYKWRTDIYGNEYILHKESLVPPLFAAGGSDTDGDGVDDTWVPGLGSPDYIRVSEGEYGIRVAGSPGDGIGPGGDGGTIGWEPPLDGPDSCGTIDCNGIEIIQEWDSDRERCVPECLDPDDIQWNLTTQVPLVSCEYFLYGGDSLSPSNLATNLDDIYQVPGATNSYTAAGDISTIIDGGFRAFDPADDQQANQYEVRPRNAGAPTPILNGFFDTGRYIAQGSPTSATPIAGEVTYLPKWTVPTADDTRHFPKLRQGTSTEAEDTTTFDTAPGVELQRDRAYYNTSGKDEYDLNYQYVIADGGWYQDQITNSFFRTRCDQATYLLAEWGSEMPDFGNDIFACKMYKVTNATFGDTDFTQRLYADDLPAFQYAAVRGPMDARKFYARSEQLNSSGDGNRMIQYFGTESMLESWLDSIPLVNGGGSFMKTRFNWLTDVEYAFMRVSEIEGAGYYDPTYDGDDKANFWTLTGMDETPIGSIGPGTSPFIKGTPDYFYFIEGGTSTTGLTYASVSANCSYIHTLSQESGCAPETWQFPQVPWKDDLDRNYNVKVEDYNDISCENVNEYREYASILTPIDEHNVIDDFGFNTFDPATVKFSREVSQVHPRAADYGEFPSKRGYFPPPVGHLRRTQTYPGSPTLPGDDEPILPNFMPDMLDPDPGFYVHDVWDGSGFAVFPGQVFAQEEEDEDDFDGDAPEPDPAPGDLIDPGALDPCRAERMAAQEAARLANPTDPTAGSNIRFIKNPATGNCVEVVSTPVDGCTSCWTLSGGIGVISSECGDYGPYITGIDPTQTVACNKTFDSKGQQNDTLSPVLDVAQMVKRASDAGDGCPETDPDLTLWKQKHLQSVMKGTDKQSNIYCRTIYDEIGSIDQMLSDLFVKYSSNAGITGDGEDILTKSRPFIDIDIIYDTLILRQDISGGKQSYVFDRVTFSHDTGLSCDDTSTYYVKTDSSPLSQHICHFFNEKSNIILVGKTVSVDRSTLQPEQIAGLAVDGLDTIVYPDIYMLDISTFMWSQIFHGIDHLEQFELRHGNFLQPKTKIDSIDPGEISYNPHTNRYSVTYLGKISHPEMTPDIGSTTVIYNHMFTLDS